MYEVDPTRLDLAEEFIAKPLGTHSADLHALMNFMRGPNGGRHYVLLTVRPDALWRLAIMPDGEPGPPRPLDIEFSSIEDAERYVFKLRWHELTGQELAVDPRST